jgi:hypothetical protein
MRKDTVICFRVDEDLQNSLLKAANESKKSLSALIETVLLEYLGQNRVQLEGTIQNRRHPRKEVSLPAFISTEGSGAPYPSMILDFSLGGLRLSLPKEASINIQVDDQMTHINVLFTVPGEKTPVTVTCKPNRIRHSNEDTEVAAAFADCDFSSYRKVQNYLLP